MTLLYLDTETYSETPLTRGLHRYAEDVEVMLLAFASGDEPVSVLDLTHDDTRYEYTYLELQDLLTDPTITKVMHNSQFDRTVIRRALGIDIPVDQVHDTMVQALAHGLPGGLGDLSEIYNLGESGKDKRGRELINLFCKPRPKNQKLRRAARETHPEQWQEFVEYASRDILAMRALMRKLPKWNYAVAPFGANDLTPAYEEHALWQLDQRINERGFRVDTELASKAIEAMNKAQNTLSERTQDITDGDVEKATQRDKMLKHILEYHGVELPDFKKDTLERRLDDTNLPLAVRELIAIRLETAVTSTGKYKKLLECVSSDGRLRGTLQFNGASRTRRWAGRLFQPQNLPRPSMKQAQIDTCIEAIKLGCMDVLDDKVMTAASNCIRGAIIPSEGKKLVVSDLSNIEGRAAAWLAGEDWKLDAFRAYDNGTGPDLYKIAYAKSFGITPEEVDDGAKSGPQRQIGKVQELMLQYEGGVGAWLTGAATYRIDLDELATVAWPNVPADVQAEAHDFYQWQTRNKRSTFGLDQKTFMTCDALKRLYRRANPAIASYWPELQQAALQAITKPGTVVPCRRVSMTYKNSWLLITMPSGRALTYASARVEDGKLTYMGLSPYSRQWKRLSTYGGKILENLCQSLSRDVMAQNMMRVEDAGYDILLSVHDELITEAPIDDAFSAEGLSDLLATVPVWAEGFPLAAGGYEADRYKKD